MDRGAAGARDPCSAQGRSSVRHVASSGISTMSSRFTWRCRRGPTPRDGMTEAEAYRRARVEIGGVEQVKERSRDVLPLRWLRDAMQDVRYGLRGLRKSPRFTIAAVLTVVLGVGANATIFSVLNPLLFKPLPYPEPERIVNVFRTSPQSESLAALDGQLSRSPRTEHGLRASCGAHAGRTRALPIPVSLLNGCSRCAPRATSLRCSASAPLIGRAFTDADDQTGAPRSWCSPTDSGNAISTATPTIVGRSMRLNGRQHDRRRRDAERLRVPALLGKRRSLASVRGVRAAATGSREQLPA